VSELLAQHQAHRARAQRFAAAAMQHRVKADNTVEARQVAILRRCVQPLAASVRRQYETKASAVQQTPISWRILRAVSQEFEMPVSEIVGECRLKLHAFARFVAIGLLLQLTDMSLPAIGRRLGGRDHTTIIHGRNRINELLQGEAFRNRFEQIKAGVAV
jgi:chromosomal replication initiation ATPase DnaA